MFKFKQRYQEGFISTPRGYRGTLTKYTELGIEEWTKLSPQVRNSMREARYDARRLKIMEVERTD